MGLLRKFLIAVIFGVALLVPDTAFAQEMDAHFFIRYDYERLPHDSAHYESDKYFPVGDVAGDYVYGSNISDYTSVDGTVSNDNVSVGDSEELITNSNKDVSELLGINSGDVKTYFSDVYDEILTEPSRRTVSQAILAAMGPEEQNLYDDGDIDVVWYVIKRTNGGRSINVDGVIYNVHEVIEEPATTAPSQTTQPPAEAPVTDDAGIKQDDTGSKVMPSTSIEEKTFAPMPATGDTLAENILRIITMLLDMATIVLICCCVVLLWKKMREKREDNWQDRK